VRTGAATPGRGGTSTGPAERTLGGPSALAGAVAAALGLSAAGLLFWLLPYSVRGLRVPVGFDAPWYAWRADVVGQLGPGPVGTNVRPGHGVLAAILGSATARTQLELAVLLPLVLAVVFALAAAGLSRVGLGWGAGGWALAAAVAMAVVGATRLLGENQANLLNLGLVVAGLALLGGEVGRRRFGWGPIAVLVAAGLVHWVFLALGLVVLVASAGVAVWERRGRAGDWSVALDEEPGIVLATVGLSAAVTGGALLALGSGSFEAIETREDPARYGPRLRTDLARLALPSIAALVGLFRLKAGPAQASGASGRRRRFALHALWAWTVVMAAGVALFAVWPKLPAHRFLALLAALPGALGLAAGLGWLVARTRGRRVLAWGAAAVAVALIAFPTALRWYDYPALLTPTMIEQAEAAGHVAAAVPAGDPVVFVLDPRGPGGAVAATFGDRAIRVGLPADRQDDAHFYVGAPEDALAGRRSAQDPADAVTDPYWEDVRPALDEAPPLVVLESLAPSQYADALALGALVLAPGVAALRPPPAFGVPAPGPAWSAYPGLWPALGWCLVLLLLLGLAGSGWSWLALGGRQRGAEPVDRPAFASLAPALGAAALVLGGLVAAEAGIRLAGPGGVAVLLAVAVGGWVASALRSRSARD
jgi:hypothetical protein